MKNKLFCLVIVFMAIMIPAAVFGLEAAARVDKTRISSQDSVFLKVIVNGGKAELDLSVITDFKVYPRGTSSSFQFINGKSEKKAIYQFLLTPLSKGKLTIPAITAQKGGQKAMTQPILIQVEDQVADPNQVKDLFAKALVSQSELVTGQQVVYTIQFFNSRQVAGLGFETRPDFKGMAAKSFENENTYAMNISGQTFQVTQVDFLLIPSAPGTVTIDPVSIIAKVKNSRRQDPFNSFFSDSIFAAGSYDSVRVVTNSVKINVQPLPEYKGDTPFSGLVGLFDMTASLDQPQVKAGDSATLTLSISGTGNIMDAGPPRIDLEALGFKVYDDNPVDEVALSKKGYQGSRTFKKALVPVRPGYYSIDPVPLIYFDTDKKRYQAVFTKGLSLDVQPDAGFGETAVNSGGQLNTGTKNNLENRVVKKEVAVLNQDILDIKDGLFVLKDTRPMEMVRFLVFLCLPGLLFSGVKLVFLMRKKGPSQDKIMTEKARRHLKLAAKAPTGDESFLSHLYSSITAMILAKGKRAGESITMDEARDILRDTGDLQASDEAVDLIQTIESVRFGGKKIDEYSAKDLLSRTRRLIKILGCLAVFLIGFSYSPQPAMANVAGLFSEGIDHYRSGRFTDAATSFETLARTPVRNPFLYYNIGNAYLKADDIGRAILWYERARLLAPNDPDLLFNLKYANTRVKDKQESSVDYMDILFFWDQFTGPKTIQFTAIFFSILFFIWAIVRTVTRSRIFSGKGILLFSLFVLGSVLAGASQYRHALDQDAVIISDEAVVRSGTTDSATKLFSLNAGTRVRVMEKRQTALKIEFTKQMVGWVAAKDAAVVQAFEDAQ